MNTEDTVVFLKNIAPFDTLDETDLNKIAKNMTEEIFLPKDFIIKQGTHGLNFYIIKSGLVRVYIQDSSVNENLLAFLGEGDCFGEISLLRNKPTNANVQTMEKTVCLIYAKEYFLDMVESYPMFMDFFDQLLMRRTKSTYQEFLSKEPNVSQVEPYLYSKQVKDMMSQKRGFIDEKSAIRDAAKEILQNRTGPRITMDDQGNSKGLVGIYTITNALLFEDVDPGDPIGSIAEKEFYSIDCDSYFFDALHCMIKNNTNTLVITEEGKSKGILTGFDLLRFRGRETLSLLRNIEDAPDLAQLNIMRGEVEKVLRELMADGALASHACKIVSEFNDKVVKRIISFAVDVCGPPPCAYSWLGLGSEGREEQTLFTDQDNAIIFDNNHQQNGAQEYFKKFSNTVVNGLNQCGIPLCKGNIMATNPKFFGNMEEWKAKTSKWIKSLDLSEDELMDTYVFLDFRSLHGEKALEKELKAHIIKLIKENPAFLKSLAQTIVSIPMPIGFFKNFIVEKSGEHKDGLNIKLYGLVPLITCLKIMALQYGITETNTLERIKELGRMQAITNDQQEVLIQAFETFLTLKIRNNLADIDQGRSFDNFVKPTELSTRQKQILKEAFWAVSELQKTTQNTLKVAPQGLGFMG
jgi:CBS domain-containing protein